MAKRWGAIRRGSHGWPQLPAGSAGDQNGAEGEDGRGLRGLLAHGETEPTSAEVAEVKAILERVGARDYTRDQARAYRDEALEALRSVGLVDSESLERLADMVEGIIRA